MDAAERHRFMADGEAAFNRGEFFEAHEFWEEVWDVADDPDRRWIQGLIQIATGLHKLDRQYYSVSEGLLRKGLDKLATAPAVLDGLEVGQLRRDAAAVAEALSRGERPRPSVRLYRRTER